MVVTNSTLGLYGRLGNQLFQIAATIGYALDNNFDYMFPVWDYNEFMQNPIPSTNEIPVCPPQQKENIKIYNYMSLFYKKIPVFNQNTDLFGYFQSEKYFINHAQIIKNQFELKKEYQNYIFNKYPFLKHTETCSIHVRRGDYLKNTNFYTQLNIEFYEKNANFLYNGNEKNVTFVIFSDDIDYCKSIFKFDNQIFIENEKDIIDLYIMSYCKTNIISNSSFSWWAAWLNKNPLKRIVSPAEWFVNNSETSIDVNCDSWIKI